MKTSKFADEAKKMADRMDRAAEVGEQLTFLPDPDGAGGQLVPEAPKAGRPKGSKNKVESQMRAMLAAKGMRMPEDVLAEIAGLSSREDIHLRAFAITERILDWAESGADEVGKKDNKRAAKASLGQRLATFNQVYSFQIKALEALLPYGLAKVTPDVNVSNTQVTTILMPGAGPQATVIEGAHARRMVPPPMPKDSEQNQEVSEAQAVPDDSEGRT